MAFNQARSVQLRYGVLPVGVVVSITVFETVGALNRSCTNCYAPKVLVAAFLALNQAGWGSSPRWGTMELFDGKKTITLRFKKSSNSGGKKQHFASDLIW